jgi:hypothetical protein
VHNRIDSADRRSQRSLVAEIAVGSLVEYAVEVQETAALSQQKAQVMALPRQLIYDVGA